MTTNGVITWQEYTYNAANQAQGWTYDAAGNLLSDGTTTRSSDALNRVLTQGGTAYQYNGDGVLVQAGTTAYAHDLAAPLSQVLADGTASYVSGAGAERLSALSGPWYATDALDSLRAWATGHVCALVDFRNSERLMAQGGS